MTVGLLLKIYRTYCDLSVRTVAKEIGVSAATISRIENGHGMDADTLLKLIDWLFITRKERK